jgi:hypothetical protein
MLNSKTIEQSQNFNYLRCDIPFNYHNDLGQKIQTFEYARGTIQPTLRNKIRENTMLKYHEVMAVSVFDV